MTSGRVVARKGVLQRHSLFVPPTSPLNAFFELAVRRILLLHLFLYCSLGDGVECSAAHFLATWPKIALFEADIGSRFSFRCDFTTRTSSRSMFTSLPTASSQKILWKKNEQPIEVVGTTWRFYKRQKTLSTLSLRREDAGNYSCEQGFDDRSQNVMSAQLVIRTPPSRLVNVSVRPSQVFASVRWAVAEGGDGGAPITHFTLVYQQVIQAHFGNLNYVASHRQSVQENSAVSKVQHFSEILNSFDEGHHLKSQNETSEHGRSTHLPLHISPSARQYFVYHLRPNALYQFKLWATNRLGSGEPILLYISTDTVQKKSVNVTHNAQTNSEDSSRDEASGTTKNRSNESVSAVIGYADDEFSATAWMVAVTMVFTIVVVLALLSCVLIYKEASNDETAFVSMYASDAEPDCYTQSAPAGFYPSAAAMQILLDPTRSFRRFYRPQRIEVIEERTVLLAESGAYESRAESPTTDTSAHSLVTRSLLDHRSQ